MLTMLIRMLAYAEDDSKIRPQHLRLALSLLSSNPVARPHLWTWIRVKWPRLVSR